MTNATSTLSQDFNAAWAVIRPLVAASGPEVDAVIARFDAWANGAIDAEMAEVVPAAFAAPVAAMANDGLAALEGIAKAEVDQGLKEIGGAKAAGG
jgi:hypothetical protein